MFEMKLTELISLLQIRTIEDVIRILVIITIVWIFWSVLKFIGKCLGRLIMQTLFKKHKNTNTRMQKTLNVTTSIVSIMRELRKELGCNAVRIWLYSNGEKSINGICFDYQSAKYEVVESGFPSLLAQSPKIPVSATPAIAETAFSKDRDKLLCVIDTDKVNADKLPDVNVMRGFHVRSIAVKAIESNKMTIGFMTCSWLFNPKGSEFTSDEGKLITEACVRIGTYFETLELLGKGKNLNQNCNISIV